MQGQFRPRLIPTLASFVGVVLLMSLCVWQLQRHAYKNRGLDQARAAVGQPVLTGADLADAELDPLLYRHLDLKGRFTGPVLLEGGRAADGQPGYAVLQRFESSDGIALLVDRGEVARPALEAAIEALASSAPTGVEGQLRPLPEGRLHGPVDPKGEPLIWPRRGIVGIHAHAGDVAPAVYLRAGRALKEGERSRPDPVLSSGYEPVVRREDSLHYASQWAAMALILVAFWAWTAYDRRGPP